MRINLDVTPDQRRIKESAHNRLMSILRELRHIHVHNLICQPYYLMKNSREGIQQLVLLKPEINKIYSYRKYWVGY